MGEEMRKRVSSRWFEERIGDGWSSKVKGKRGEGGKERRREGGRERKIRVAGSCPFRWMPVA